MKKVTKKQKARNKQLQFKINLKYIIESKKANHNKDKKRSKLIKERLSRLVIQTKAPEKITQKTVIAPKEFSLINQEGRKLLLKFLKEIKHHLSHDHNVHISFDDTQNLLPCGTLWATAQIEFLLNQYPGKVSCSYPTDDIVEQLFQHIGLLKKLGKDTNRKEIEADNVKDWHYISGASGDLADFVPFFQSLSKLTEDVSSGLFESLSEAVTNTIHWAYKDEQAKEWRMFAQHKDGCLHVAICDLGMGIPNSLKEKPGFKEWVCSILHKKMNNDKSLIKLAVESSASRSKFPHRGKGLKDMLGLVKNGTVGGLSIFSGQGGFSYDARSKTQTEIGYETAINGTIIQWQISLEPDHEQ